MLQLSETRLRDALRAMREVKAEAEAEAEAEADGLSLVGGSVLATDDALAALLAWLERRGRPETRWWRCVEWTDRVRLEAAPPAAPRDIARLLWGRWFGEPGDLELWRENESFRWRFVGDARAPDGEDAPGQDTDFFRGPAEGGAPRLRAGSDVIAYLWGAKEGQVATATRKTMALLSDARGRSRLRYTPYYDRGALGAVRYREILGAGAAKGSAPEEA